MEVVAGLVSGNSKTMSQYACTYVYVHCFFVFFMPHVFCLFCLLFLCYFVLLISLFFFLVLPYLVPVIGCTNTAGNAWKLEQDRTCFSLPGRLPYSQVRDRE